MIDRHPLFFVHGLLLVATGLGMLVPAFADAVVGSRDAQVFLVASAVTISIGGLLVAAGQSQDLRISRKTGFLLAGTAWLSVSVFAALPFYFLERAAPLGYVDCFFEAVSGLTTTGSTVFSDLDTLPPGLLLWRGMLNWFGGFGMIVMAFVVLPFLQVGGAQLYRTQVSDMVSPFLDGARNTAGAVAVAYGFLSVVCALLFWFQGMTPLDAVVYAMATVSTGGFTNHDASLGYFPVPAIQWIAIVFMVLGSAPYILFVRMGQGEFLALVRDSQVRVFAGILLGGSFVLTLVLVETGALLREGAFEKVLFSVVSIGTTTGFYTTDYTGWGPLFFAAALLLMFIGGCAGSPAGGLKILRVDVMARLAGQQIRKLLDPHAVVPLRYDGMPVSDAVLSSVAVFVFLYLCTVFAVAFGLALTGLDVMTSLSGAAAAVGNAPHGLGPIIGPAGTYAPLPEAAKILLALGMILGRTELFVVLVLFTARYWRS